MKVQTAQIEYLDQKTNALIFLPESEVKEEDIPGAVAIFAHGYTADKSSLLNWAVRLAEMNVPSMIFDWPGHYLGNFSEVSDFNYFKVHAHELFATAFLKLKSAFLEELPLYEHLLEPNRLKIVLGGHSLGAMLSLKALSLPEFSAYKKMAIAVGLGMAPKDVVHVFDTPFYKSTLKIREQLVSMALKSENVFPWIKEEKEQMNITGENIHLICGEDDLVVGSDGAERFFQVLKDKNNNVTLEKPSRLPHHEPQLAASYIKKHLKKINWI